MANAYLLTNGGSGEDGDEWLLHSIHATKEGAEAAKTEWYREVEEWEIEGSLLTDAERDAIGRLSFLLSQHGWTDDANTLRGVLDRCAG